MNATGVSEVCGLVGVLLVKKDPRENNKVVAEADREVLYGCSRGGGSDRMAESISTPSPLSHGASSSTPPRGQERSEEYHLAISSQPPSHVFLDEPFEVAFTLESYKVSPNNSPPSDIRISVLLEGSSNGSGGAESLRLRVLEEPRLSVSRRSGRTKCCIQSSRPLGNASVATKLRFNATGVMGCVSHSIAVVRAKLQVSVGEDWTDVWYKDEGGRDKSIETIVSAYDRQNNLLREPLQLEIKLCYDANGTPAVTNQDILKRLGSDRGLQIDSETGRAKIRFRVEDVSKNHQGQNFVLLISAAKTSGASVGPALTPPVNVRSKRNKRQRMGSARGSADPSQVESTSASSAAIDRGAYVSNEQLREALQDVIRWSEEVVSGMCHIQWRVMGYASNADGSIDYSRPYHNMQNPNPVVDRLLALYNQSTRENIRFLQHTVLDAPVESYPMGRSPGPPMHHGGMMPPSGISPPPPHTELMAPSTPRGPYSMPGPHSGMPMHPPPLPDAYGESTPPVQHYQQDPHHPQYYPHPSSAKSPLRTSHHDRLEPLPAHPAEEGGSASPPTLDRESEVEYVLARQYKSLRTGQRLGFPAYSDNREILGFYRDSPRNTGVRQFIPVSDQDFGPSEKLQAKKILDEAIHTNSRAVQSIKDCGSISSVLDRCLVYDFSKDIGGSK